MYFWLVFFFFFKEEAGIGVLTVAGVQTFSLPSRQVLVNGGGRAGAPLRHLAPRRSQAPARARARGARGSRQAWPGAPLPAGRPPHERGGPLDRAVPPLLGGAGRRARRLPRPTRTPRDSARATPAP